MQLLSIDKVSKAYFEKKVLNEISFEVDSESFISIFGPNAAGKTTLLNIIAGLSKPDSGQLRWSKENSIHTVSYVFQNYRETLFPWKNIWENITLPLKLSGVNANERKKIALELIDRFSIELDLNKFPYELSGGQQQLVAIMRAIVTNPTLLLLDEPFSALDFPRRLNLQNKVLEIWKQTKTTIIFVSHDIDEAIFMADNVILLGGTPTIVRQNVEIDIERPRLPIHLTSEKFVRYKKQLLSELFNEIHF